MVQTKVQERILEVADTADKRLADTAGRFQALEAKLALITKSNEIDIRLPLERRTTKTQVIFVLKSGKLHGVPLGSARRLIAS